MKRYFRRITWGVIMALLVVLCPIKEVSADNGKVGATMLYRDLTPKQLTEEMGAGWNLGNTMDGHTGFTPGETVWQGVKTTKALIQSVHDLGFNTVRIPVTWGTKIDDENDYAIEEAWLSRIQDIVDYCVSLDMYAIINIHHDGAEQTGWLRIASDDLGAVKAKYVGVWKNIATRLKDYDEHLIFESMNEVKGEAMTVVEENKVIMDLNQIFVDTVRGTGSNNSKRWLVVTGKYNFIDSICNEKNEFSLPKDSAKNKLMVSVHNYTPWQFCGSESTSQTEATYKQMQYNKSELSPLYEVYSSKGVPVIVGEYGCINKDNAAELAYYLEAMNRSFRQYDLIGIYWDQGWYDRSQQPDYSFSIIDRTTGEPIEKEITDAMMRGRFLDGAEDLSDIIKNTQVSPFTSIILDNTEHAMSVGDVQTIIASTQPSSSNDVLLYKSSDETVATVAYGKIRAKGVGTATITVSAQSGAIESTIRVTVSDKAGTVPCAELSIKKESYKFSVGEYDYIASTLVPENTDEYLYYRSSDESVVTVSPIGKILAIGEGSATITVSTSGGLKKEIKVNVTTVESAKEIQLAINVYYNDSKNNYYSNEVGSQIITVNGDGQYTLKFNCATDLSSEATKAGVTNLSGLTAIYIKDNLVTQGITDQSPLESCNIVYNRIVVNNTILSINNTEPKSALKSPGIFDTNDPINFWDGSYVNEVSNGEFTTVSNPLAIEITFTLSDVVFVGGNAETTEVADTSEEEEITTKTAPVEATEVPSGIPSGEEATEEGMENKAQETMQKSVERKEMFPVVYIGIVILVIASIGVVIVVRKKCM